VSEPPRVAIAQWSERILWAKSPNLTLTPGDPIPLVSWPGTNTDRMAVELLQKNGTRFCVSFSAPDFAARLAAVVAGLGVLAVPSRLMFDRLEIVQDGLPALPDNKTGIFARDGLDVRRYAEFLKSLSDVVAPLPQHLCEAETVSEKPVAPKRGKETVSRRAAARVLIDQF
jgi:DNA-binding transcriptional LysR family regulator